MKKNLQLFITIIFIFCSAVATIAQSYNVTKSTEPYVPLTGGTNLTANTVWDDPNFAMQLGFTFRLFSTDYSILYFNSYFYGGALATTNSSTGKSGIIAPLDADLVDKGWDIAAPVHKSPILYKTDGNPGSRIFKVQWTNAGFLADRDENDTSISYINMQVWVYEGSNNIEFRYGPSSVPNPTLSYEGRKGAPIGIWPEIDFSTFLLGGDGIALGGTIPNEFGYISYADTFPRVQGTPSNGTVYKFSYDATSVKNLRNLEDKIELYPKPANNVVIVKSQLSLEKTLTAIDISGKKYALTIEENTIDLSTIASGVYIFEFKAGEATIKKRMVKL